MIPDYSKRRRAVVRELRRRHLDALLVTHAPDWYYLTGFSGDSGALFISADGTTLLTDGRFTVQAAQETRGLTITLQNGPLFTAAGNLLKERRLRCTGYDPTRLTVEQLRALEKAAGKKVKMAPSSGIVEPLRLRKDAQELEIMRGAARVAGAVLKTVLQRVRPGVREIEIAAEIEYQLRKRGASGSSFEPIVASGPRAALPHARPTSKKLRKNELVVLDLGAILAHYCSDMTRTVHLGRASRRVRQWYRAVQQAQQAAVHAARAGVSCGEVDAAAREVLQKEGLERYFVHSTGHGLGLEVHEAPRVARGQAVRLQPGNVITIEPGVYMEGAGGIRIEDDVVIHTGQNEVLTRFTRDLIEL